MFHSFGFPLDLHSLGLLGVSVAPRVVFRRNRILGFVRLARTSPSVILDPPPLRTQSPPLCQNALPIICGVAEGAEWAQRHMSQITDDLDTGLSSMANASIDSLTFPPAQIPTKLAPRFRQAWSGRIAAAMGFVPALRAAGYQLTNGGGSTV